MIMSTSGEKAGVGVKVTVGVALAVGAGVKVTVTCEVTVTCGAAVPQAVSKNKVMMLVKISRMGFLRCG
jgi:hypothetical protein